MPKLGSTIVGLSLLVASSSAHAQDFGPAQRDVFGLVIDTARLDEDLLVPKFADFDGDGDLDMISAVYELDAFLYQENIGTVTEPAFGPRQYDPFGLNSGGMLEYVFPLPADFDDDGDVDLLIVSEQYDSTFSYFAKVQYIENIGTVNAPTFAQAVDIPSFSSENFSFLFSVADIDGDGRLDLFSLYSESGSPEFWQNVSSGSVPEFANTGSGFVNTIRLDDDFDYNQATLGDLDLDGDLDILVPRVDYDSYSTDFVYYENNGSATAPGFADPVVNPFNLSKLADVLLYTSELVDIDGDGDLDLFNLGYLENGDGAYILEFRANLDIDVSVREASYVEAIVYPNPTTEQIQVDTDILPTRVTVYNAIGKQLSSALQTRQIRVADFAPGSYYLVAELPDGTRMRANFTKQR